MDYIGFFVTFAPTVSKKTDDVTSIASDNEGNFWPSILIHKESWKKHHQRFVLRFARK